MQLLEANIISENLDSSEILHMNKHTQVHILFLEGKTIRES